MAKLLPPDPLSLEGNLSENWRRWKQRFNIYMKASGNVGSAEDVKKAILLHCVGPDALDVFNTFKFNDDAGEFSPTDEHENRLKYTAILDKFEEYCNPRKNTLFERYKFWKRSQAENPLMFS
jgi:hypothetical protein